MAAKAPGNDLRSFKISAKLMEDMRLNKIQREMFDRELAELVVVPT